MTKTSKSTNSLADKLVQPRMANQCKVCRLVHTHPAFWIDIHDKVLKDNNTRASVVKWANAKIEIMNANEGDSDRHLPLFTEQNFAKHFNKHNTFELQQAIHRQRILVQGSRLVKGEGFSENEKAMVSEYGEDFANHQLDEYLSIAKMVKTLEDRLWAMDEALRKKEQKGKIGLSDISTYQKRVESLIKMKLELSKLRNSSVVAGAAVQAAVEFSVATFVESMMLVTEEAKSILTSELPSSNIPGEVTKLIRNQLADKMKASIPSIVEKVEKDFKIK